MKKLYLIILLWALCRVNPAFATIHVVEVQDYSFSPANFIANVGDTIHWMWIGGSHTTTSTSIPASATSWDQLLTFMNPDYTYIVNVPGVYNYVCTPHISMGMNGSFTVVDPTSVEEFTGSDFSFGKMFLQDGTLLVEYNAPAEQIIIQLFDITGHQVYFEKPIGIYAGLHRHSIPVGTLPSGIYILNLMTNHDQRTRRLVID